MERNITVLIKTFCAFAVILAQSICSFCPSNYCSKTKLLPPFFVVGQNCCYEQDVVEFEQAIVLFAFKFIY